MNAIAPISVTDINTTVSHDPRILDVRVAARLGYERPADIRELIERNADELATYGEVFRTVRKTGSKGGRPGKEFWLNEAQTLLVCMFSKTDAAATVRKEVIEVYMAYRRAALSGDLPASIENSPHVQNARRILQEEREAVAEERTRTAQRKAEAMAIREKRLLVKDCKAMHGPQKAQALAVKLGLWTDVGMPELNVTKPEQHQLGFPTATLRDGMAFFVVGGKVVTVDTADTALKDQDEAMVVRNWSARPQMPFVSKVCVIQNYGDRPAQNAIAHLPAERMLGTQVATHRECRILGRVLAVETLD
ncbi:MAG TPA: hypothetical protein VK558_07845 [Patescibacteria group bacterium]|nr:hypothetical protein [Patescibacteria group bacterium]